MYIQICRDVPRNIRTHGGVSVARTNKQIVKVLAFFVKHEAGKLFVFLHR